LKRVFWRFFCAGSRLGKSDVDIEDRKRFKNLQRR
jgi:hypothetical protein